MSCYRVAKCSKHWLKANPTDSCRQVIFKVSEATEAKVTMKVAIATIPKDSGTFTFYRNMRESLLCEGVELICVTVGKAEADLVVDKFLDDGCRVISPRKRNLKRQARDFVNWCITSDIDIVIGLNSIPVLSAIPHLPDDITVAARCANGFDLGYRVTLAGRERLKGIVALTPKLRDDLIAHYEVQPNLITLIPNGVNTAAFEAPHVGANIAHAPVKICFLGRLEHNQKGVMHIPAIIEQIERRGVPYQMSIAGQGIDEQRLRQGLKGQVADGTIEFVGRLDPRDIPGFLNRHDVFLFTSHFEGCPNALLEALAAGTVSVSSRILGTTDFIVQHGVSGFICDVDNPDSFAEAIDTLSNDRLMLRSMKIAARERAQNVFSIEACTKAYATFFKSVSAGYRGHTGSEKDWRDFKPDPNFPWTWRRFLSTRLKERVKRLSRRLK